MVQKPKTDEANPLVVIIFPRSVAGVDNFGKKKKVKTFFASEKLKGGTSTHVGPSHVGGGSHSLFIHMVGHSTSSFR